MARCSPPVHLGARLVKYKVPREVYVLAALPKTSVGKVDKNRLREELSGAMR